MKAKKKKSLRFLIPFLTFILQLFPPMDGLSHFTLNFSLPSPGEFKLLQRFTQLLFLYEPDEKLQISANHCKILGWGNTLTQLEA